MSENKGFARDVLSYLGVDLDKARSLVLQHATDQHAHSLSVLIAMATEEADQRPFAYTTTQEGLVRIIGTTHVLVALFKGEESLAGRVLSDQKITPDRIYEAQKDVLEQTKGPYNRPPEGMR